MCLFDLITLTLDGGHDLIGAFRVSAASGGVGLSCTFHDSSPVILPRLRRADCYSDHGFDPLSSICESPLVALPATSLEITHTPRGVQTTLQKLRASVSTVVHRIKEDFKLVGRLAITW